MSQIRIIGLGNTMAGDDGVGLLVARRLRSTLDGRASVIEAELAGVEVLDLMTGARLVILIDAARSGRPPGTIHRIDISAGARTRGMFPHSTHAFHAMDAVELARTLGTLPPRVVVYAIEALALGPGPGLSPPVELATTEVMTRIQDEIGAGTHAAHPSQDPDG